MAPSPRPDGSYRERLWPGPLGWSFVVGFAVLVLIALLPVRVDVAVVAALVSLVVALVVAVRTSARVEVADGELRAGAAHIPVTLLGAGSVLDRAGVRARLGPGSDARTFACLRSWIPGAVEVVVDDPQDPTPAWLVSTRRPAALLAAVEAARRSGQAAHSEQIG
ncbi:DUF3093 domain-containing protein [Actinotalea solisilvae]|uniref:DUF3093 domain-containing protein n=1 Tax=Actinotalea solisilvae TaxID=2072922 RepID=UPI0018F193D5|nr:DUF3093 domain-containing protein [Actinotalea solisilvae]